MASAHRLLYRSSLQTILCPNVHNTGTSQPLMITKLQQHRTMKNALYMLCEDRNCEWTDLLESVTSSMNATINSATTVSPHYTITSCHSNIGLPKLLSKELASDDLGVYGMQINALLRQVHHCIARANDETDHKLEASLNRFIYKDPIQVGDKVLLHQPQSTRAQSSNLPWIGEFKVIKTNDVISQVQNENGDTAWIHRAHIHYLKQWPAHLSHIPPPPHCITLTKTPRIPRLYPLSSCITLHRTPYRTIYPFKHHKTKQNKGL